MQHNPSACTLLSMGERSVGHGNCLLILFIYLFFQQVLRGEGIGGKTKCKREKKLQSTSSEAAPPLTHCPSTMAKQVQDEKKSKSKTMSSLWLRRMRREMQRWQHWLRRVARQGEHRPAKCTDLCSHLYSLFGDELRLKEVRSNT